MKKREYVTRKEFDKTVKNLNAGDRNVAVLALDRYRNVTTFCATPEQIAKAMEMLK